jgi:type IV pilus assembly protein PilN
MRRDRPILIASAAVGALLCVCLIMLIGLAISDQHNMNESRLAMARVQRQLVKINAAQVQVDAQMRLPENSSVLDRSVLFNTLIRRKAISWTRIFSDLETVLPHNVRVVAIRPQLNGRNQLSLDMVVAADKPEQVIDFVAKLEGSDMFGDVTQTAQTPPTQNSPYYQFRLTVTYDQKL